MLRQDGVTITQLTNIGNELAGNSVLPIVNMRTDETEKATVALLSNFILNEAGNLFPVANVANTVAHNAQPNITSVGTLISLTSTGIVNLANTSNVSLGNVSNLHILGGNSGFVLHTDGNGSLYWDEDYAYPGGANTSVQFNDDGNFGGSANFTFDSSNNTLTVLGNIVTGNLTAENITGNLGNLTAGNIVADNIDVDTISIGNIELQSAGQGTEQQVLGIINQNTQQLGWKTIPVYYITVGLRDGNTYLANPNAVLRVYPIQQRNGSYLDLNVTQI